MLFNSYQFILIFLPLALLGFFLLSRLGDAYGIFWLIFCSLFFYGYWNHSYVGLLLISIVFNYLVGFFILRSRRISQTKKGKPFLILGLLGNLILLGYYKYANFFVSSIGYISNSDWTLDNIILPLGISFFTFTQIAYLVDAYQGKVGEANFMHYILFVTYFPHLIAGPVLHHKQMMPQFSKSEIYHLNIENLSTGVIFLSIGMAKKVLLADNFSDYAKPIFDASSSGNQLHFFTAWIGALAFAMQIYFDFSGYSDMAVGISKMFGVDLPINFNSPYKAKNIIDFWRRWHISLSYFLRDYLYIPLGGNRRGALFRYMNLFITMLLGGLWHGANWTLVAWGGVHGLYLCINHAWNSFFQSKSEVNTRFTALIKIATTFICVVFAWVFFRSENIESSLSFIKGMIGFNGISLPKYFIFLEKYTKFLHMDITFLGIFDGLNVTSNLIGFFGLFAFSFFLIWGCPNSQELVIEVRRLGAKKYINIFCAVILGFLMAISMLSIARVSEFLYFQF